MVQTRMGENFKARANGATFGIVSAVDEARDSGLNNGASAHTAGLDGHVERRIREAVVAEKAGRFTKSGNFRMRRWVAVTNRAIPGASEYLAVMNKHSADGDFAGCCPGSCFGKR